MRYVAHYITPSGVKEKTIAYGTEASIRRRIVNDNNQVLSITRQQYDFFKKKPNTKEIYLSLKSIGNLLSVGIGLIQSFEIFIEKMSDTREYKFILNTILYNIKEGFSPSNAFLEFESLFSGVVISMLRSAEKTGNLSESFEKAGLYLEESEKIRKELINKISYPLTILVFSMIAILFNTQFVIPKIIDSELMKFVSKEQEQAFSIEILHYMNVYSLYLAVIAILAASYLFYLSKKNRLLYENIIFRVPYVKQFIFSKNYYIAFISFSRLVEAGLNVEESLKTLIDAIDSEMIKKEFRQSLECVERGENFAFGFTNITSIEQNILINATPTNISKCLEIVALRFHDDYITKVQGLGAKIYFTVLVVVLTIAFFLFYSIYVPYAQIIGRLLQ